MSRLSSQTIPCDSLLFPVNLDSWAQWEAHQHPARRLRDIAVTRLSQGHHGSHAHPGFEACLALAGSTPEVLVVVDAFKTSLSMALIRPLTSLLASGRDVAVLCPPSVIEHLPTLPLGQEWKATPASAQAMDKRLGSVHSVLAAGHYLELGALAYTWARAHKARFCVIQHGLLTPFMAPLPKDAHLFAWSQADAEFWLSGRRDVTTTVVGSQLLWQAAQHEAPTVDPHARPTFLGQLHGVELGRRYMTQVSTQFLRETGGLYRPHPSEKDRLSRATHALWERQGYKIDRSGAPLFETGSPVVGVFSTGILEAAARGIPAWYYPPSEQAKSTARLPWLTAFHERYNMSPWGEAPAARPEIPDVEPAQRLAELLVAR